MLTNVTFVGRTPTGEKPNTDEKVNTRKLLNACNSINDHQLNEPVENRFGMKFRQLNKRPNKRDYNKELLKGLMTCSFS